MAITGLALLGFVVAHLLGNLQIFLGPEKFNGYAKMLKDMPMLIWPARLGLLGVFIVHIVTAISLSVQNKAARPVKYGCNDTVQASTASLYMLETGLVIFFFVLIHLAHFTLGILQPDYYYLVDAQNHHDVYTMVIRGFQHTGFALFYIFCMLMIGTHLSHGIASSIQTIGFGNPKVRACAKSVSCAIGWGIAVGYISIPLSVLLGIVTLP